jgi:anti-sigma regulatory factor (Ser/Thr protein kinase)
MSTDPSHAATRPEGSGPSNAPLSLSFLAQRMFLAGARDRIRQHLEAQGVDETAVYAVDLILEELVGNTIRYGYGGDDERTIRVDVTVSPTTVRVATTDDAKPFDPTTHRSAEAASSLDGAPVGGRGISMVRRVSQSMSYRRDAGKNKLEIDVQRGMSPS